MLLCRVHQQTKRTDRKGKKAIASLRFAIFFFIPVPRLKLAIHPVRQFQLGKTQKRNNATLCHIKERKELLLPLGRQFFFLNVHLRFAIHPVRQTQSLRHIINACYRTKIEERKKERNATLCHIKEKEKLYCFPLVGSSSLPLCLFNICHPSGWTDLISKRHVI